MPLYEYECESCRHRFEVIQKFSDALVDTCPTCGGKVTKLFSSPAIQFKGSGWYVTDYARAGKSDSSAEAAKRSADTPASESKSDSKSESKSESKAESKTEGKSESKTESKDGAKKGGSTTPSTS
jgi:putative FmdB family regulatory protein